MILNGNWIMNKDTLLQNALKGEFLSPEEGVFLFENVPTAELMEVGNTIRFNLNSEKKVTIKLCIAFEKAFSCKVL